MIDKQKAIEALEIYKSNFTSYHSTIIASCIDIIRRLPDDDKCIALPCKGGDIVYDIQDGTPYETKVLSFSYFGDYLACRTVSSFPDFRQFGKRIFLTREEAEAALKGGKHETDL